eukprot:9267904-Pyramimonas_sp.AAC.2
MELQEDTSESIRNLGGRPLTRTNQSGFGPYCVNRTVREGQKSSGQHAGLRRWRNPGFPGATRYVYAPRDGFMAGGVDSWWE